MSVNNNNLLRPSKAHGEVSVGSSPLRSNNNKHGLDYQSCPVCENKIGVLAGSSEAICQNCGFKDPCCE